MALQNGAPQSGGFFSAKDYASAAAVLVETFEETQANKFKSTELEPAAKSTITIFSTPAELESGNPGKVLEGVITQGALGKKFLAAKNRDGSFDELAGKLEKVQLSNGNSMWDLKALSADNVEKLVAYMEARDADLPDFMN